MTNILIGIGGTGAKVVEAALGLFTAGLGPQTVHVGVIDQDRANGNVNRTLARLKSLRRFQRVWGGRSSSSIDWSGDRSAPNRVGLGSVTVEELFGDRALWCPEGDDLSLTNIIGQDLSPQQRDLFDLLFMPGEQEQDLQLGEGFRGRAHVGAAALIAAMLEDENELVDRLRDLMQTADRTPVRIFLVGSAFGGTGAAGFPTLARELHRIRTDPEFTNKGMVSIGGALMLPYFGFARPDKDGEPVVTTDELLPKAQLALEYYGRLFETERTFDKFYVMGWDPFFNLGYHQPGNFEQRNPPLLPELFAATAAVEFLSQDFDQQDRQDVPVMLSARTDSGVRWSDFPLAGIADKLGQLIRFSAYWLYFAEQLLNKTSLFGGGNWTQPLRGKMKPVDHQEELESLRAVAYEVLSWAAATQATTKERWSPGPWDTGGFLDRTHESAPTDPVALATNVAAPEPAFDQLIRADNGEPYDHGAAAVYESLVSHGEELARGNNSGYGRVVAATYRATSLHDERAR
ncbi:MAG TPA: hypothetical protein VEW25_14355 [Allosphingosinicella sp.]|nr:hypothetical protein [Allosphingosinicella sp.]